MINNKGINFIPTKTWLRNHKYRPSECSDSTCHCIIDHFNHLSYGFCIGILLNVNGDLDIISFCHIAFNKEQIKGDSKRYLWHPNEALLISSYLNLAVINAFGLIPNIRKQLGYLNRARTRKIHTMGKVE